MTIIYADIIVQGKFFYTEYSVHFKFLQNSLRVRLRMKVKSGWQSQLSCCLGPSPFLFYQYTGYQFSRTSTEEWTPCSQGITIGIHIFRNNSFCQPGSGKDVAGSVWRIAWLCTSEEAFVVNNFLPNWKVQKFYWPEIASTKNVLQTKQSELH